MELCLTPDPKNPSDGTFRKTRIDIAKEPICSQEIFTVVFAGPPDWKGDE